MTPDGLTIYASSYGPKETMDRLTTAVVGRGMTVLAHIDHAEAAAKVGMKLRPTDVLIFGNAKAGTPLMQTEQTVGIDLPLKALVWEDDKGKTWLACNDPAWIAKRHAVPAEINTVLDAMTDALADVAKEATILAKREWT